LKYELKKTILQPYIYIGILIASALAVGVANEVINQSVVFSIIHVNSLFASIAELIICIYAAKAFGDDFQFKTSTTIFSSSTSRNQLVSIKVLSIVIMVMLLAMISGIISVSTLIIASNQVVVSQILKLLLKVLLIYMVYGFCLATYTLFLTIIARSTLVGMIASMASFWIGQMILGGIAIKFPSLMNVIRCIPYYSASRALEFHEFGEKEVLGILLFGIVFLILSKVTLRKMDII
jgi:ABC-type transport system involved in multi-copper enzyme maturation permease subunit